jgi:receptor protein-tyrosine kinase
MSRPEDKQSIIERLAQRMELEEAGAKASAEAANAVNGVTRPAPLFELGSVTAEQAPIGPAVEPQIERQIEPQIRIDLARLRKAGMVTPTGGRERVFDEFRIIKRPILLNVSKDGNAADSRRNLVMVTSARPGEGKTFTAISLAMSVVAEQDVHVLLVDADLSKRNLSHTLGLRGRPGLIDLLCKNPPPLADVLLTTDVPRLNVLPAGGDHPLANELLAGPTMRQLVRSISDRYRHGLIIFDTSPALVSTDPSVLALSVGQVIMVVQANRTSRSSVQEALALLKGCDQIHLVLNRVPLSELTDQYGRYSADY